MLVQRFQDMILRQLYECEYEEWSSEDDEGDWEWVWEDEEDTQGDQMQKDINVIFFYFISRSVIHKND